VGMLVINPKLEGEGLLLHIENLDFLITPILQRLFMSPKTTKHVTWRHSHDAVDGVMMYASNVEA
jgi:hypothetical protein